jgi:hypothetical protein
MEMQQHESGHWRNWREWSLAAIAVGSVLVVALLIAGIVVFRLTFLPTSSGSGSGTTPIPSIQRAPTPTLPATTQP